ncbi:hypothetical protein L6637_39995 [Bradyrhizobium sp. WYCCWR 12774]|uniref:Transposase IS4-like domain-containing protein n=1 Tax=Bradyrhizobium zhengyangense TaxID=2911009 RepID=A0ABS9M1F2_9BRAD|nr:hypothetical protein [Bradyrhizobium zhengyangense]MCG2673100.1 hypothetical protein [Bradyrhizobium zhengyangense]
MRIGNARKCQQVLQLYCDHADNHSNMGYSYDYHDYLNNVSLLLGPVTLTFASQDSAGSAFGPVIGDVNVSAVPDPSIWPMMITGFLGVGFLAYRRQLRPRPASPDRESSLLLERPPQGGFLFRSSRYAARGAAPELHSAEGLHLRSNGVGLGLRGAVEVGERVRRLPPTPQEEARIASEMMMNDGLIEKGHIVVTDRGFFAFRRLEEDGYSNNFAPTVNPLTAGRLRSPAPEQFDRRRAPSQP